jgi:hypothetical protein
MHVLNWGATDGDLTRVMAGDAAVPHPNYETTMAVEIEAEPSHVWPWLMQMGYRRGGLYSYDWIDRLFGFLDRPSARRILPQFQNLHEGDVIPIGRSPGFPVLTLDPGRALVIGGTRNGVPWIWEFGLYPIAPKRTRLVSRNRAQLPGTWAWRLARAAISPAIFLMNRRMLIGLKQRAEALAGWGTGLQ